MTNNLAKIIINNFPDISLPRNHMDLTNYLIKRGYSLAHIFGSKGIYTHLSEVRDIVSSNLDYFLIYKKMGLGKIATLWGVDYETIQAHHNRGEDGDGYGFLHSPVIYNRYAILYNIPLGVLYSKEFCKTPNKPKWLKINHNMVKKDIDTTPYNKPYTDKPIINIDKIIYKRPYISLLSDNDKTLRINEITDYGVDYYRHSIYVETKDIRYTLKTNNPQDYWQMMLNCLNLDKHIKRSTQWIKNQKRI